MSEGAIYEALRGALAHDEPVALATVIEGPNLGAKLLVGPEREPLGSLGDERLDAVVTRDALGAVAAGRTSTRHYGAAGEARERAVSVFIESFVSAPQMLIFGAVDFTAALARTAKFLGYRVTVCDARPVFATPRRFPEADEVVNDWPDRFLDRIGDGLGPRDAVCVLTHDHKFDIPAIVAACRTGVGYLGAMGSRRTHAERVERLRAEGLGPQDFERLMAPIGLDIGARTPEETAIAICAEIIAARTGRSAPSLRDGAGPIHRAIEVPPGGADEDGGGMELGIDHRRAAVAAASEGLGFGAAAALAAAGAHVAVCGRRADRVERAVERLGDRAVGIVADVGTVAGASGFVQSATERLGGLDILVTNAGGPPPATFATASLDGYLDAFEANCRGAIAMCDEVVPAMRAQQWGRVVAITSIAVRQPIPTLIYSNTARAGLTGFLKTLAREVAADGVTVNSLLPGTHDTERIRSLHGGDLDRVGGDIPAGFVGDAGDFGQFVAFLCSEQARFVTGTAIPVDGGAYAALL